MNYKTILAASGIAVIFSFSQPFSNQLANATGSGAGAFRLPIAINDPCTGAEIECRYVFTAQSGSNKQITMARTEDGVNWYYYNMPIYTKTEVQAGYYVNTTNNNLVLMVVYSADREGKSGATVSRVSYDYGWNWTASLNITDNQHKFGLAVAPDSQVVAILNNAKIQLHGYINGSIWDKFGPRVRAKPHITSNGLAVILDATNYDDGIVAVSYVSGRHAQIRAYDLSNETWKSFSFRAEQHGAYWDYTSDTAWLKRGGSFWLAVKQMKEGSGRGRPLGVLSTTNLANKGSYSSFREWVRSGGSPISGLWQDDDGIKYILSTKKQKIKGTDSSGNRPILYQSNQNSSM